MVASDQGVPLEHAAERRSDLVVGPATQYTRLTPPDVPASSQAETSQGLCAHLDIQCLTLLNTSAPANSLEMCSPARLRLAGSGGGCNPSRNMTGPKPLLTKACRGHAFLVGRFRSCPSVERVISSVSKAAAQSLYLFAHPWAAIYLAMTRLG